LLSVARQAHGLSATEHAAALRLVREVVADRSRHDGVVTEERAQVCPHGSILIDPR
jgi:hypothetical protein